MTRRSAPAGAVVVDLAKRRREREKELYLLFGDDEYFAALTVLPRKLREKVFSGAFDSDVQIIRTLLKPEDRARFDVLAGTDLEWEDLDNLPSVNSEGGLLLSDREISDAVNALFAHHDLLKQVDETVISQRIREMLKDEGLPFRVANDAVKALNTVVAEYNEMVGGEVIPLDSADQGDSDTVQAETPDGS